VLSALNLGYRVSLVRAWSRFLDAASDPERAQASALRRALRRAEGTAFGAAHGLSRVRTLADFQSAVPIRGYDEVEPWIERVRAGEPRVLTREPPLVLEKSSGSTSASKYIPYTRSFLAELGAATGPWIASLLSAHPQLRSGSSYWSISPVARERERAPGGLPVGFEDDTEYFPPIVRRALRMLLPVPRGVARLPDIESCRHATLRYLLADEHLALISVWNPSFLVLLLEHARAHREKLARDIERGTISLSPDVQRSSGLTPTRADPARGRVVREALESLDLERLWPKLTLVSCWTDAAASLALPALARLLPPRVTIQGKGLLATEGVVSIPVPGVEAAVLAVGSHLLELAPADDPKAPAIPCARAEVGGRYRPILTTGSGLYRYDLGDIIEVVGRFRGTHRIRFVGRADGVSDLRGEKLSPARVGEVLARALAAHRIEPRFVMLAPIPGESPSYALLIDADARGLELRGMAAEVEDALREGHGYEHARALGQLEELRLVRVRDGTSRYEQALVARGAKAGNVKPAAIHAGRFWAEVFPEARDGRVAVTSELS
jgi:hypothetical protein